MSWDREWKQMIFSDEMNLTLTVWMAINIINMIWGKNWNNASVKKWGGGENKKWFGELSVMMDCAI